MRRGGIFRTPTHPEIIAIDYRILYKNDFREVLAGAKSIYIHINNQKLDVTSN